MKHVFPDKRTTEVRKPYVKTFMSVANNCSSIKKWRLDLERFSNWKGLTRIQAWTARFIENCRSPYKIKKRVEFSRSHIFKKNIEGVTEEILQSEI